MKPFLCAIALTLCVPSWVTAAFLAGPAQLSAEGANFNWEEAKSRSLKILVEYQDRDNTWKRASLGSGFFISPDGLFVTAYHVMKYCLVERKEQVGFSRQIDCSKQRSAFRYKAWNRGAEYEIEILSFLRERDSLNGRGTQTPDETIKYRDFVIGRLKAVRGSRFPYWPLRDFKEGTVNLADPRADFEFKPLLPPRKVFITGYPLEEDFNIAHGFLNLTEANNRGYFAADLTIYNPVYLESHGIARDTKWGIRVENHMSGGAVIDAAGFVVGVLVNGGAGNAGVLSIENVLETFFSRSEGSDAAQALFLSPTRAPLYLKKSVQH